RTQAGSSAARDTTAAWKVFARVDIRIQRVMGLNRKVRRSRPRTYPSMTLGPAASHGSMREREIRTGSPSGRPSTWDCCPLWQDQRPDAGGGETSLGSYSLPGPRQQTVAEAGQTVSTRLLTRRAGVHVDFHAHRHFHNLRSFPTHQACPKQCWHDVRAGIKTRLTSNVAQARNIRR